MQVEYKNALCKKKIGQKLGVGDFTKSKFRKGVGSGDAVERSCGWEEEMREELRKDWCDLKQD